MEKLTSDELADLCKRADEHIGKTYPVPAFVFNTFGKRTRGTVDATFVGYTKPRFATKERQSNEKSQVVTFHIPNAKLKNSKGVTKMVNLLEVVQYFESQENNQSS